MVTAARCTCTSYGRCAVCRPILPTPNRPRPLPDPDQLPTLSRLLDDPLFPRAAQRMADRLGCHTVEVAAGLLHFFAVIEGDH